MGVLWVICMFFDHRIAKDRMRTLKGSVRFMCGNRTGSCGFHTRLGIRLCNKKLCGHRADAIKVQGKGKTLQHKPVPFDQQGPARLPQDGLLAFYRHKIEGRLYVHENTVPVRVQTSSKQVAGLQGMPCDYPRSPDCQGASYDLSIKHLMLRQHETSG